MALPVNIAVLGAGSWGTALALCLARNQHNVTLWAHNPEHIENLQKDHENNKYLEGFPFPENLNVSSNLAEIAKLNQTFLLVVPSRAFRHTIQLLKQNGITQKHSILWGTKGFDEQGPDLLSDVIKQELGDTTSMAIITGPSFSKEVAANLPTAMTIAGNNAAHTQACANLFHSERMRVYTNNDLVGVQVGGAAKNVMAIAAGISDGLGFGANSRAAIISRGLTEITRLGTAMGANTSTFSGLAGLGDLVLTCTDNQSRNRQFGLGLGSGKTVDEIIVQIGQEVEGFITTKEVYRLAQLHSVEMPITEQVYAVLYEKKHPKDAVKTLLKRSQANEHS